MTPEAEALAPWRVTYPSDAHRIAVMEFSFGGTVSLFAGARTDRCKAVVSFAAAAMSWRIAALQAALLEAVGQAKVPIFLIQAANDFSLLPTYVLGAELARQGKPHETRVYAPCGTTNRDGHFFMQLGIPAWSADVQRFLDRWLRDGPAQP